MYTLMAFDLSKNTARVIRTIQITKRDPPPAEVVNTSSNNATANK